MFIDNLGRGALGAAPKGISEAQKKRNRRIATPRAYVEHVVSALAKMGGKLVRCIGIVRVTFALHFKAASYNLKRLVFLKEGGLAVFRVFAQRVYTTQ